MDQLIDDDARADYVYMYPPRQAYRSIDPLIARDLVIRSLRQDDQLNIYVHFPFCSQICSYCNLFVSGRPKDGLVDDYVGALILEIQSYSEVIFGRKIETIYLGGGTPSLLPPQVLKKVLDAIVNATGCQLDAVPEVSLEISPETVDAAKLQRFREIGINRVNLGVQTAGDAELHGIGRLYRPELALRSVETALSTGFTNVCVDLIYGLQHQTDESWATSIDEIVSRRPDTICIYALTLRPRTAFSVRGYRSIEPRTLYRRYDRALERLMLAGYQQENHVRYIRNPSGGYRQKANHWAGQNVLGFGAGARSYLKLCDVRNGYSTRKRRSVVKDYISDLRSGVCPIKDGFVLNALERQRKRLILGLFGLDRGAFRKEFGVEPLQPFGQYLLQLAVRDLLIIDEHKIALTPKGARHRDIIAQLFFSEGVRRLVAAYKYDD